MTARTDPSTRLDRRAPLHPVVPDGCSLKFVGLGGVGGIAARYACMFLASLQRPVRVCLIDGDAFEDSNATRMFFSRAGNKAQVLRDDLLDRFADTDLTLVAIPEYITPDNVARLLRPNDIIMLCVDNHATRRLVSEHCQSLPAVTLISGGNDGVEPSANPPTRGTFGNCQIHLRRDGQDLTAPLTRYHPEIAHPADTLPTDKSCTELLASVPQIMFANLAVASAMLNAMWLILCDALGYSELALDIAQGLMRPVGLPAPPRLRV